MSHRNKYLLALALPLTLHAAGTPQIADIEQITLVKDAYPYWSPDGRQIVFQSSRSGNFDIWVMRSDGTGLQQLTDAPESDEAPVWTRDGKYIVFASYRDGNEEIYRMKPDGSEQVNLSRHPSPDGHPKVSSDSQTIIFNSGRDSDPSLFPGEVMVREMTHEIYEMDIDGNNPSRLTWHDDWDTFPSISPDGTRIAWRSVITNDAGERDSEIFVADRNGENPVNLSKDTSFDGWPAWTADGDAILFASNRNGIDENDFNLYVVDIVTMETTQLTDSPGYEDARPIATHDGRKIVFNRQIGGTGAMAIFVADFVTGD